jgi:hypothetical protein
LYFSLLGPQSLTFSYNILIIGIFDHLSLGHLLDSKPQQTRANQQITKGKERPIRRKIKTYSSSWLTRRILLSFLIIFLFILYFSSFYSIYYLLYNQYSYSLLLSILELPFAWETVPIADVVSGLQSSSDKRCRSLFHERLIRDMKGYDKQLSNEHIDSWFPLPQKDQSMVQRTAGRKKSDS